MFLCAKEFHVSRSWCQMLLPRSCLKLSHGKTWIKATTVSSLHSPSLLCFQVNTHFFPQAHHSAQHPRWCHAGTDEVQCYRTRRLCLCVSLFLSSHWSFLESLVYPQEDAVPARMILKSALTLLLLMASRQAEITWFLGLPTELKKGQRQINKCTHSLDSANMLGSRNTHGLQNLVCPRQSLMCTSSLLHKVSFIVRWHTH